jgi:hypothetical protein
MQLCVTFSGSLYSVGVYNNIKYVTELTKGEHRLKMHGNRVLSRIFRPKRKEGAVGWARQRYEELHNFYALPDTKVYQEVSGLAAWSENFKWYSSAPLGAVVSLFCESF